MDDFFNSLFGFGLEVFVLFTMVCILFISVESCESTCFCMKDLEPPLILVGSAPCNDGYRITLTGVEGNICSCGCSTDVANSIGNSHEVGDTILHYVKD